MDLRVTAASEGMGVANLAELCSSDCERLISTKTFYISIFALFVFRDYRLRELVIDLEKPVFKASYASNPAVEDIMSRLSSHQHQAIVKVTPLIVTN